MAFVSVPIFGAVVFLLVTEPLQSCDLPSLALPPMVDFPFPVFAPMPVEVPLPPSVPEAPVELGLPVPDVPPDVPEAPAEPPELEPAPELVPPAAIADVAIPIVRADTARIFKNIKCLLGFVI
jgi:hypothetical protein